MGNWGPTLPSFQRTYSATEIATVSWRELFSGFAGSDDFALADSVEIELYLQSTTMGALQAWYAEWIPSKGVNPATGLPYIPSLQLDLYPLIPILKNGLQTRVRWPLDENGIPYTLRAANTSPGGLATSWELGIVPTAPFLLDRKKKCSCSEQH